jgi:dTMP kinase
MFIVFEGPHGSGKSFYSKSLVRRLRKEGHNAIYTKEPHSKPLKRFIRKISTEQYNDPYALFFLVTADRFLHLKEIQNHLAEGAIVVSDRYFYSTAVYQGIQGISSEMIQSVNHLMPLPDILFYIDTPYSVRLKRLSKRKRTFRDIFYNHRLLRLENKSYNVLKQDLKGAVYADIVSGESKEEISRITAMVIGKINRNILQ